MKYLIILLFLFSSCQVLQFQPESLNHLELDPPVINISLDFNSRADTLVLWGSPIIKIKIDNSINQGGKIELLIDGEKSAESIDSIITFNTTLFDDGLYKLKIMALVASNGPSIASQLKSEYYIIEKEWPLIIENRFIDKPIMISNIEISDKGLQLNWNCYPYQNFERIEIVRMIYKEDTFPILVEENLSTITDRDICMIDDSTYIGGEVKYKLVTYAGGKIFESEYFNYYLPTPVLTKLETLEDNSLKVNWTKSLLTTSFESYEITRSWSLKSKHKIFTFNSVNDTSFIDSTVGFGPEYIYSIKTTSKTETVLGNEKSGAVGIIFPSYHKAGYNKNLSLFTFHNTSGTAISDADAMSLNYYPGEYIEYSPEGNSAYKSLLPKSFSIFKINPNNFDQIWWEFFPLSNKGERFSSNEFIVIKPDYFAVPIGLVLGIYNSNSDTILYNATKDITVFSNNGELFYSDQAIRRIKSNSVDIVLETGNVDNKICFTPDNMNYIITDNNLITVHNIENRNIVATHTIDQNRLVNPIVDPLTGYLGVSINDFFGYAVYDLESGELIVKIKTDFNDNQQPYFFFAGGKLFYPGSYISLF